MAGTDLRRSKQVRRNRVTHVFQFGHKVEQRRNTAFVEPSSIEPPSMFADVPTLSFRCRSFLGGRQFGKESSDRSAVCQSWSCDEARHVFEKTHARFIEPNRFKDAEGQ
ncbi:MAG TPA: hypothetical protein VNA25_00275, partial [Phycisphaerae bacterium]|nr:hypothetical protein [Phycisphaerae bacterium]